jgi:hypothetical protein
MLKDEVRLATRQPTAANTACYLAIIGFWASLDLNDVVERVAMGALREWLARDSKARRFAADRHGTPLVP